MRPKLVYHRKPQGTCTWDNECFTFLKTIFICLHVLIKMLIACSQSQICMFYFNSLICMMAYHRQWRRYHSEVNSLIESSEDEQDVHIFEHVHQLEQQHGDIEPTCSHNEEEIIEMDHVASNSDLDREPTPSLGRRTRCSICRIQI